MDNDGKKKAGKNGKHSTRDLPVAAEGGSEGLLNPATAPRAREEAKHRGDNVTAVKSKDLKHRSIEEFGQQTGFRTYDAEGPGKKPKDRSKPKPPLDQRRSDG